VFRFPGHQYHVATKNKEIDASIAPKSPSEERTKVACLSTYEAEENTMSPYATREDFCKLFTDEAISFYLLSFLLTAKHERAEQCFVAGLDECVKGSAPFKAWVRPWARRTIIRNAIRMMMPRPGSSRPTPSEMNLKGDFTGMRLQDVPFASILVLEDFERFVYVLSVLERYPDQNCALLLDVAAQEVRDTRRRAFQRIAEYEIEDFALACDLSRSVSVRRGR
jgi:hypothetical protein